MAALGVPVFWNLGGYLRRPESVRFGYSISLALGMQKRNLNLRLTEMPVSCKALRIKACVHQRGNNHRTGRAISIEVVLQ